MSELNTAIGKLHEILASWDDQNKAMDIVGWYNSYMCKELEASRKVVEAARKLHCRPADHILPRHWVDDYGHDQLLEAIKELEGGEK